MAEKRIVRLLAPALAPLLLAAACSTAAQDDDGDGDDIGSDPIARVAAGTIPDTDIFVATVVEEDRAIAYFCGGDDTFDTHTIWFSGAPGEDGAFDHTLDGWRVVAQGDADGASGTLTLPDGTQLEFDTAAPRSSDSIAGLYRADIDGCLAGVVVTDESGQLQAQGTLHCPDEATFVQVIILAPVSLTNGGIDVEVEIDGLPTMLRVMPV